LTAASSPRPFRSCLLVAPRSVDTLPVVRALHSAGFAVLERSPDDAAFDLATSREFDLVAWHSCGDSRCSAILRSMAASATPLIALLVEATPAAVAASLEAGADACLQLDADERVVVAQAHAVLRRRAQPDAASLQDYGLLQVGGLTVDVDRCEVEREGVFIALTASEFRIVEYMARNAGRVLRPHEILNAVSEDYEYLPREAQEVFKVYARRIRRKLEPSEENPRYLVTVRGFGYRLEGGQPARSRPAVAGHTA
jgi:DNA-binding response OmpR family regulator